MRFEACDLRDIEALRAAVERVRAVFGPITGLLIDAAPDERHATLEVSPGYFDERIAVNFRHQFFAAPAVIPDMQAAGRRVDRLLQLDRADGGDRRDAGLRGIEVGGDRHGALAGAGPWAGRG